MREALIIRKEAIKSDQALQSSGRGARKVLVTGLYAATERMAETVEWLPPSGREKCSVQVMEGTEAAIFNHHAKQDRHFHRKGTEIYMVAEGRMVLEVEANRYEIKAGDIVVVNPPSVHKVENDHEFLCYVICVNCGGPEDKFVVE
jgi:quercetin dioxygenase-like cupin family protein